MLDDRYYMRSAPFEPYRSATAMVLIANAVVFVLQCVGYGYPPSNGIPPHDYFALSWWGLSHGYVWQLLTFQFLHGGLVHLLLNCWVIYIFGRELEMEFGRKRFLWLYFGSGIIGGLAQAAAGALSERFAAPTVGASAGALGLLAAFATLHPDRQLTLLLFFVLPINLRARYILLFSAILAVFGIIWPVGNMADAAHLGGMFVGMSYVHLREWSWQFPRPRWFRRRSSARRPGGRFSRSPIDTFSSREDLDSEVDTILDKISAHGIHSLSDRERRILEQARQRMVNR